MNKSGNVTPTTSIVQMTGWTADGSYPATNIVSNQLVVDRAGTINVTAALVVSANSLGATVTGHIYKNGVSIKSVSSTTTGTLNLSTSGVTVAASDVIDMRVTANNTFTTVSASGTYLQIDGV